MSLSKNSIYTSDCHHNLTRVKFTDGNSLTHHNSLTINMTSSSAQSKLLCHSAEKGLLVITYVLPMGYQPIRFIEPAQLHFCLKHDSDVSIPCTAIGSPLPFTEILDTPRFSSYLTRHSNNSQSFNFKFNDFFDGKSFTCKAANYWEEKNLTFYLGESSDCRTPIEQPTNQTGAFKSKCKADVIVCYKESCSGGTVNYRYFICRPAREGFTGGTASLKSGRLSQTEVQSIF